jgi:ATP-dependent RNA helicase MSS116
VSTLAEDEVNTHEHGTALHCNLLRVCLISPCLVLQTCVTVPIGDTMKATLAVLQDDVAEHGDNAKSMVFCTTAWGTSATAQLLKDAGRGTLPPVYEIHSKMTQNRRLAVAQDFKRARSGILVTSDVTARGMDFPGSVALARAGYSHLNDVVDRVTLVVQVGLPSSSEQYIHRLGRTARAGRSGKGVIILTPHESGFLRTPDMRALPIQPHPELQLPSLSRPELDKTLQIQAYGAWLGFNTQYKQLFKSRQQFVNEANKYARDVLGWADEVGTPPLGPKTARNLGIHGLDGVNTSSNEVGWGGHQRSSSPRGPSRTSWQGEDSRSEHAFGHARRSPRQDSHKPSWQRGDGASDHAFGHARRSPRQDTHRPSWQRGESDHGFGQNRRSPRQDTHERSSYGRSDTGSGRSPRWSGGGARREQSWAGES